MVTKREAEERFYLALHSKDAEALRALARDVEGQTTVGKDARVFLEIYTLCLSYAARMP